MSKNPEVPVSPSQRRELLELLLQEKGLRTSLTSIPRRKDQIDLPLSFAQQRLWFLDRLEPGSSAYNMYSAQHLQGPLNIAAIEQSINQIFQRHESLRTTIHEMNGEPIQVIIPFSTLNLRMIRLQDSDDREAEVDRLVHEELECPFDLAAGPLIRAAMLQLSADEHILLFTLHHIISDAWSSGVIFRELEILYEANLNGKVSALPELPIQYGDYALWQKEWFQGKRLEEELSYWKNKLDGAPQILKLPTDYPRPSIQSYRGAVKRFPLPSRLSESLKELAQHEGATSFMVFLAAFAALLHRYTGNRDLVIGSPISNRNRVETEDLIGLFVNTLLFRLDLSGNPTFREFIRRVREICLENYSHQDVPFERLVEHLRPERKLSRSPLFQVMFDFVKGGPTMNLQGLTARPFIVKTSTAKFDLSLFMQERESQFSGAVEYCSDLFEGQTVERMIGHFQNLLEVASANPDTTISALRILTDSERRQLLFAWNKAQKAIPDVVIHQLFERQVIETPDATAVIFDGGRTTYAELNARANKVARGLQKLRVGPEVPVGVCTSRSLEMVVSVLGILKAGGAYVPLDPTYPKERLSFLIANTGMQIILTQQPMLPTLPKQNLNLICLDSSWNLFNAESEANPPCTATSQNLAYILHTSGSTGKPKGVAVTHHSLVNHSLAVGSYLSLSPEDRVLQFASLSFDVSADQIFSSLASGASIVLRPDSLWPSIRDFVNFLQKNQLTVVGIPAALWHEWVSALSSEGCEPPTCTRLVFTGSELVLSEKLRIWQRKIGQNVRWVNGYGPTEATINATLYEPSLDIENHAGTGVPIGHPIANTTAYVLNEDLEPVPIGVPGELYLGGEGLARGYFDNPKLSAERFLPNPFSDRAGTRMYKTGDRVRYLSNGNIEFLGRVDYQVKIRGVRVEPAEIEAAINEFNGVEESVVLVQADDSRLVAYVLVKGNDGLNTDELRHHLRQKLPEHMVPSAFVRMENFPVTSGGKIDRTKLPPPEEMRSIEYTEYLPPRDELEYQLTKIWEKALSVRPIGMRDNFFDLGGHSLLAVKMFSQVEKLSGKNLPLATLFQAPTIEHLARILRDSGWTPPWSSLVAIQPRGSKPPLYCVHAIGGNIVEYLHLGRYLGNDQPLYGVQAQGLDGKAPRHDRIEDMADHYIKEIRSLQPEGPYYLAGTSFGGLVAFEMAHRIVMQGEKVGLVGLFDTNAPGYPKYLPGTTSLHRKLNYQKQRFLFHLNNLRLLEPENRIEYVQRNTRKVRALLRKRMRRIRRSVQNLFLGERIRVIQEAGNEARKKYLPPVYGGKVVLFRASHQPSGIYPDPTLGWDQFVTGELEIIEIPGYHGLVREPLVRTLAARLKSCLELARHRQEEIQS